MQQRAYKFRLYPNKEQKRNLQYTLDGCRFVYNQLLEGLNAQEKPNKFDLQNSIPHLKDQHPWLKNIYSKVLTYESYRLFSNLKALSQLKKNGKKIGKLRFKGKNWFKTFTVNQSGFKVIETDMRLDRLHLSKIGDIPIRIHRETKGNIKQIIVKKYPSGKWYASICTEVNNLTSTPTNPTITKPVGLDMGIKYLLTDSDGRQIENPHNLKKSLDKLKKVQQNLSRKKKGSNNRIKARVKVAKTYEGISNQRNDFLHKVSRLYIDNYNMIAIEDLNITNMVKNRYLSQSINDAAWRKFAQMLSYKAESANKIVVRVDPRNTSKEKNYGELDRDYNASLNILQRGLEKLPQGLRKIKPVEIVPLQELTLVSASTVIEAGNSLR